MSNDYNISSYNSTDKNIEALKTALEKSLSDWGAHEEVAIQIRKFARAWIPKQLNKRFATALQAELGDGYSVYWGKEYNFDDAPSLRVRTLPYTSSDDYVSVREVSSIDKMIGELNRYIEAENDVMTAINDQKRIELRKLTRIARDVAKAKKVLLELKAELTDSKRNYGSLSYPLQAFIAAEMEVK